jgi:hypothetical protein
MDSAAQQYDTIDLLRYAYEGQPSKVQDVFNELMMGKLYDSIQQKKIEVAQNFFGTAVEADSDEDYSDEQDEEDTDGEDS